MNVFICFVFVAAIDCPVCRFIFLFPEIRGIATNPRNASSTATGTLFRLFSQSARNFSTIARNSAECSVGFASISNSPCIHTTASRRFFGFFASAAFVRLIKSLYSGLSTPQRAESSEAPVLSLYVPSAPAVNAEPPRQQGTSRIPASAGINGSSFWQCEAPDPRCHIAL